MEIDLKMVSEGFEFGGIVDAALKKFFEATKEKLAVGKYENGIGNKMYRDTISDMRPEFVEEVKDKSKIRGSLGNATEKAICNAYDIENAINEFPKSSFIFSLQ